MEERMTGFYIKAGGVRGGHGGINGGAAGGGGTKCGRWNPTAEQVKVLTELFRSGLRTPSTDQIQKISTQLSFYGKIESKNVFYWFQNHKARERQKRRKVSTDDDEKGHHLVRKENEKISTTKSFTGFNHVMEPAERVIETLQLFPLNPFEDSKQERLRFHGEDQCRDFTYTFGADHMDHPPLDLRLSFV